MRKNLKYFITPLILYPFNLIVSIDQSDNVFKKILKKEEIEWNDELSMTNCDGKCQLQANYIIIRLSWFPDNSHRFGVLAHEIFHSAMYIMDDIGMKFEIGKSDEAYAYLIAYLTTEIYKQLNIKE